MQGADLRPEQPDGPALAEAVAEADQRGERARQPEDGRGVQVLGHAVLRRVGGVARHLGQREQDLRAARMAPQQVAYPTLTLTPSLFTRTRKGGVSSAFRDYRVGCPPLVTNTDTHTYTPLNMLCMSAGCQA